MIPNIAETVVNIIKFDTNFEKVVLIRIAVWTVFFPDVDC